MLLKYTPYFLILAVHLTINCTIRKESINASLLLNVVLHFECVSTLNVLILKETGHNFHHPHHLAAASQCFGNN